jgi:hypothetical protein
VERVGNAYRVTDKVNIAVRSLALSPTLVKTARPQQPRPRVFDTALISRSRY